MQKRVLASSSLTTQTCELQLCADPCDELASRERLHYIVVGSRAQRLRGVGLQDRSLMLPWQIAIAVHTHAPMRRRRLAARLLYGLAVASPLEGAGVPALVKFQTTENIKYLLIVL